MNPFLFLLLNLFGYTITPEPVRLQKKLTLTEKIRAWVKLHEPELLFILIIAMMIILVLAIIKFFPAMDIWNNRFEEVI